MAKTLIRGFAVSLLIPALLACAADNKNADASSNKQPSNKEVVMKDNTQPPEDHLSKGEIDGAWYTGTLKFYNLEGGFYGFHGENGERFLPLGLDSKLQQNGAQVKIYGYVEKGVMTIQQWGEPFKVLKAELLKPGSKSVDKSKI